MCIKLGESQPRLLNLKERNIAILNMENQQGPAGQHRELCSILCNNLMVTRGKDGGKDSQGVWDGHGHMLYVTWRTSKDLLSSTGNSAQCHVAAWTGGEFGGEWILRSPAGFLYLLLCSVSCVLIHHIAAGKLPWTLVRD